VSRRVDIGTIIADIIHGTLAPVLAVHRVEVRGQHGHVHTHMRENSDEVSVEVDSLVQGQ